jgi:hypothetical protein
LLSSFFHCAAFLLAGAMKKNKTCCVDPLIEVLL